MSCDFYFDFVDACEFLPQPQMRPDAPLSAKQVKDRFIERGMPVSEWADQNGFRRCDVYVVLSGQTPARRGIRHQIAVALGIKPDPTKAQA